MIIYRRSWDVQLLQGFPICYFIWHSHLPQGEGMITSPFMKKLKSKQDKGIDWKWSRSTFKDKSLIGRWHTRVVACTHKTLKMNSFNQPNFPAFTNRRGPSISTCTFHWMLASLYYFQGSPGGISYIDHSHDILCSPLNIWSHEPHSCHTAGAFCVNTFSCWDLPDPGLCHRHPVPFRLPCAGARLWSLQDGVAFLPSSPSVF